MAYYSRDVLTILLLMIVTGAARTLAVKFYYEMGYNDPLLVTILFVAGHALALPFYIFLVKGDEDELEKGEFEDDIDVEAENHARFDRRQQWKGNPGTSVPRMSSVLEATSERTVDESERSATERTVSSHSERYIGGVDEEGEYVGGKRVDELSCIDSNDANSDDGEIKQQPPDGEPIIVTSEACDLSPPLKRHSRVSFRELDDSYSQLYLDDDCIDVKSLEIDKDARVSDDRRLRVNRSNSFRKSIAHSSSMRILAMTVNVGSIVAPGDEEDEESLAASYHLTSGIKSRRASASTPWSASSSVNLSMHSSSGALERPSMRRDSARGSKTGLTKESADAVKWVHCIPWWLKPLIPSMFNLVNTVCRWAALRYLDASICEMLIGGLELVFSVFAARLIRKRRIPKQRWYGVTTVVAGLILIGASDFTKAGGGSQAGGNSGIGILFIFGKVIFAVLQDLSEELFMQESSFPAFLLLGMEGAYALVVAIPLYFAVGPSLNVDPVAAFKSMGDSVGTGFYTVFLIIIFFAAGVYQILSTGVTSSMTRNLWKNFRGLLVWVVGLVVYYGTRSGEKPVNEQFGEPWLTPQSFMVLGGFVVVTGGLRVYYKS